MKQDVHKHIRKLLSGRYAGFVLVTCKRPMRNGTMQVEMTYDGDPILAAYLLDGAQGYLEESGVPDIELSL